jgi:hypothetical protein
VRDVTLKAAAEWDGTNDLRQVMANSVAVIDRGIETQPPAPARQRPCRITRITARLDDAAIDFRLSDSLGHLRQVDAVQFRQA